MSINGILNVNKPPGPTSFQVVARIKRWSGEKRVGHAGTLDPQASGTFPVCLGQATRVIPYFLDSPKTYRAVVELGIATDTYDGEGKVMRRGDPSGVTREGVEAALQPMRGRFWQRPPPFSALKYQGRRLYELARAGVAVEPAPRQVEVFRLELKEWNPPQLTLEVECGRGIYLRSMAHDLGEALGCGGYLRELVRLRYGIFSLEQTVTLARLESAFQSGEWRSLLYPPDVVLEGWPKIVLGEGEARLLLHGQPLSLRQRGRLGERARAYSPRGDFLAILRFRGQLWHPERVFPPAV